MAPIEPDSTSSVMNGSIWPQMPPTSLRPEAVPQFVQPETRPLWRPTMPPML